MVLVGSFGLDQMGAYCIMDGSCSCRVWCEGRFS